MNDDFQEDMKFTAADDAADDGEGLILDIDGYEGPLHLLLELARKQKVDLARISILELAEQFIAFIKAAQDLRIELAADYLVMAAWLAYLKSRMILPNEAGENEVPEAEELAAHLAFRLERLEAMRRASDGLFRLPQMGQNIFKRGAPEGLRSRTSPILEAELFDVLKAYAASRSRATFARHKLPKLNVLSLEAARNRLRRALNSVGIDVSEWTAMDSIILDVSDIDAAVPQASIRASSLLAGLELAKEGDIDLRQTGHFEPIYLRGRSAAAKADAENGGDK